MTTNKKKPNRRMLGLIAMLATIIVIGALIAYGQISLLYVLVTLALVALLLIVGFADLEKVARADGEGTTTS